MRPIKLLAAGALLAAALCGSARAGWQEELDAIQPACRHTPTGQMTHAQLEECDVYARAICGMDEAFKAQREKRSIDHANCRAAEFIAR